MSKRNKTFESTNSQSSNAYIVIELNNEDPYEAPNLPMGRDKVKRKLKGGQSSLNAEKEIRSDIKRLDSKFDGFLELGRVKKGFFSLKLFHKPGKGLIRGGSSGFQQCKEGYC